MNGGSHSLKNKLIKYQTKIHSSLKTPQKASKGESKDSFLTDTMTNKLEDLARPDKCCKSIN